MELEHNFPTGALSDVRPESEKLKDFSSEELFAGVTQLKWIDWEEWTKNANTQKFLEAVKVQNQDGSSSCMAQAGTLCLGINNYFEEGIYKRFSPRPVYARRRNKSGLGMYADDLGDLLVGQGAIFEDLVPSDGMNETEINKLEDYLPSYDIVSKIYRAKSYVYVPKNIDEVASILSQKIPVVILLKFGNGEWAKEVPVIIEGGATPYGHGITGLPGAYFMFRGQKAILIQDSWGLESGMFGRRILTEDWFKKGRVKAVLWFADLDNLAIQNSSLEKPKYTFTKDMVVSNRSDEVAMLQRCLGYLTDDKGYLFPLTISPTGYYGGITRSAVKRFQALQNLVPNGSVNESTRRELNLIFS